MLSSKGWSSLGLLALSFASTVQSSVVFEDDFDSSPAGSFPAGWTLLYEGAGAAAQFIDRSRYASAPQSLTLRGSPCWSAHAYHPVDLPVAGAKVIVTTKVYSGEIVAAGCSETLVSLGIFNPQIGRWGTPLGAVIFKPDGYMYAISEFGDGVRGTHVKVMQYAPNRWYSVRTDLDLDSKMLSVSVDGELKVSGIRVHALDSGRPSGIHLAAAHGDKPKAWFDDVSVEVTAAPPTSAHATQDGVFDGTFYSEEFRFGFRISGDQGVATVSNSWTYQVGDVMLRFVRTGERSFRGEQLCTDGVFHPVTGVLNVVGDLEMTIEGCSPTRYTMVKQREPAQVEAGSSSAAAADTTAVPFTRGQVWRGQYLCSQGPTNLDLVILGAEAEGVDSTGGPTYRVSAMFDFNFNDGAAEGAFFLIGTYRSSDRSAALRAREWIQQPDGYVTVDMEGRVSADGSSFSGIIPGGGCGAFAVRQTSENWVQEGAPASGLLGACGSDWWQRAGVPDYLLFENSIGIAGFRKPVYFGQACLAHDSCYGRAGSQRSTCDLDFLNLLQATCDETLTGGLWAPSREKCRSAASGYFLAVSALGCEAFRNAQRMSGTVDPSCN